MPRLSFDVMLENMDNALGANDSPTEGKCPIWFGRLAIIMYCGPLIGWLGTIVGMTQAFQTLEKSSNPSPEVLAGNIQVAMFSTLIGLLVGSIGLVLVLIALFNFKIRTIAFFRPCLVMSIVWCIAIYPYGAVVGLPMAAWLLWKRGDFKSA